MSLQFLYEWASASGLGGLLQNSQYAFPVIEVVHLIGLTMFLGPTCVLNLRFLGMGLTKPSVSDLAESVNKWLLAGLVLTAGTGALLFFAEAFPKLYENEAWRPKMLCVAFGLVFLVWQRSLSRPGVAEANPVVSRAVAVLSLVSWFGAGIAGRAIGFM